MAVFVVTWNLNKERANYAVARAEFIKHLERYSNTKDAGLESVRWIESSATADAVCADLRTKLDGNDRIFLSQIQHGSHQGWTRQEVWDWINARL